MLDIYIIHDMHTLVKGVCKIFSGILQDVFIILVNCVLVT